MKSDATTIELCENTVATQSFKSNKILQQYDAIRIELHVDSAATQSFKSSKIIVQQLPDDIKLLLNASTVASIASNQEIAEIRLDSTVFDMICSLEKEPYALMRKGHTDAEEALFQRADLLNSLLKADSMHQQVASLIAGIAPVPSVRPDDTLDRALALLVATASDTLSVLEGGLITGVVKSHDILAVVRHHELLARRAQRHLGRPPSGPRGSEHGAPHGALEQPTHLHRQSVTSMQGGNTGQGPTPRPAPPRPAPHGARA